MYCSRCLFVKQKTAYEMRISDWSSDVCSSDLVEAEDGARARNNLLPVVVSRRPVVGGRTVGVRPEGSDDDREPWVTPFKGDEHLRSEEHTSELQSLMRI